MYSLIIHEGIKNILIKILYDLGFSFWLIGCVGFFNYRLFSDILLSTIKSM